MYRVLLAWKYLRRKLAPLFAALAVTLCTAMTVIVISVMGGFLDTLKDTARGVTGDIVVRAGLGGFGDYEGLLDTLRADPAIRTATPALETLGIVKGPAGPVAVQLLGIDFADWDAVIGLADKLAWSDDQRRDRLTLIAEMREDPSYTRLLGPLEALGRAGTDTPEERQIAIAGIETLGTHSRADDGSYDFLNSMVGEDIEVTVVPLSESGSIQKIDAKTRRFRVANEFKSGMYQVDAGTVLVPFDMLQGMLDMAPATVRVGADAFGQGGRLEQRPGRTHQIVIRAADSDADLDALAAAIDERVAAHYADGGARYLPRAMTWRQKHRMIIGAVENEKGLVTFLFVIISVVAVVMVATTFYMIVLEKTRDIGVLRAIGATRSGIASVFLAYGLAIGLLGAVLGLVIAAAVVLNLNEIQALLDAWFGWRMWDPQTYFFDRIPARIDPREAAAIGLGAVVAAVLGAVIPALLAARVDPVRSLRYE